MTIPSDKVIYVEAGKDTFYKPANVETGYTVSNTSDGLTYTDKGFNGAEPNKSYTANYTGSNSDGAIVMVRLLYLHIRRPIRFMYLITV